MRRGISNVIWASVALLIVLGVALVIALIVNGVFTQGKEGIDVLEGLTTNAQ